MVTPRTHFGGRASEGTRLFRAALAEKAWTHVEAADRLGTSKQVVHALAWGDIGPKPAMQVVLEQLLKIPASAWGTPPSQPLSVEAR